MEFKNRQGQEIEFNPLDQTSIDWAKAQAPGEGVGPAVGAELVTRIACGEVTKLDQLPSEYKHLGQACGLSD